MSLIYFTFTLEQFKVSLMNKTKYILNVFLTVYSFHKNMKQPNSNNNNNTNISEASCDTEDWSDHAENSALNLLNK